jgi:hypothetical protein
MNFLIHVSTVRDNRGKIPNGEEKKGRGRGFNASQDELLGLFPRICWVAEVTIGSSLAVNRLLQVELLHDDTRPEVPILPDNLDELRISFLARAICIDEDRQGLRDTNSVGELNENTPSKASGN